MRVILLLALITLASALQAAELEVRFKDGRHAWSSSELLKHPQARDIEIIDDVSYKRTMRYRAVPLSALLEGVTPGDHLQAVALDGFAAELPAATLLASEGAKAWLAIENPQHPWPPLAKGKPSARVLAQGGNQHTQIHTQTDCREGVGRGTACQHRQAEKAAENMDAIRTNAQNIANIISAQKTKSSAFCKATDAPMRKNGQQKTA
jgi:hypothetical protein